MITTLGKQHIRSYLAGLSASVGQSLALGIRPTPATASDTEMGFEVIRVPITSVALDPMTDKIVFKGTMESANALNVYEVGLWSSTNDDDSSLILGFDEQDEAWEGDVVDYTEDTPLSRIGTTLMNMTVTDASPAVAIYPVEEGDLTGMLGPEDKWSIAFNKVGTAALNVKLIIRSLNGSLELKFFPSDITAAGYTFGTTFVKDGISAGSFEPSEVTQFDIIIQPAAGNAATSTVQLDGVVADNAPSERDNSVLVARSLVSPHFSTDTAMETDVEYELSVTL